MNDMRTTLRRLFVSTAFCLSTTSCAKKIPVKDGDIIFHTSRSSQSEAVQRATHSKYSHMGVIIIKDGSPFVFEAINKVSYTPLKKWIARGLDQKYIVKRVKDDSKIFTQESLKKFRDIALPFEGKPYDLTFEWSDDKIYCSELVWKIYNQALDIQLGALQKLKDFDLTNAAVLTKLKERYGQNIPLNETVISPQSIFESENLITVAQSQE